MIQFNLLPDIKLQYMKAQRTKRTVTLVAGVTAGVALTIMVGLVVVVDGLQKKNLNDLNGDIKSFSTKLQSTTDVNKILTIQNQLKSLPALYAKTPVSSRLFVYLTQLVPNRVSLSDLKLNFDDSSFDISGAADTIETVNTFADSLKFTTYKTATDSTGKKAFSNVVLTNFTRNDKQATYEITCKFDPTIFDPASNVALTIPNIISTRSETEKPAALFQETGK